RLMVGLGIFFLRRDRDGACCLEKGFQARSFRNGFVHHEADRSTAGTCQQHGIYVAHMVTDQYCWAFFRDMFQSLLADPVQGAAEQPDDKAQGKFRHLPIDRKSTRLNSSHVKISYAVFCLKKKNKNEHMNIREK